MALLRAGRAGEAIPHLERAIALAEAERNPIFTFYLDLGRAYVAAGRVEDGVTQFRRARERAGPTYPLPGFDMLLGDALVRLGRDAEALPYLRKAVDADSGDAIHRLDLGRILYNAERYDEAQRYLQEAIDLRPDLVDAYIGLAFAYNSLGKQAEARQTATRAVDMARRVLPTDDAAGVAQSLAPLLAPPQ
jgi:tetratricopeptide (TPR) repeat protein